MTTHPEPAASGSEIRVLSAGAMGEIVDALGEAYTLTTGIEVSAEFSRSPLVRDRIRAGEPFDVAVTTQSRIDELARAGKVVAETAATVARSLIGVAVQAGNPRPDIASVASFVSTLRAARSIACADPAFGTASGLYLKDLFDRLGLTAELQPKLRLVGASGGEPLVVCAAVADGRAELGIQQIAEIVPIPGVDLVGPIPQEIQHTTAFAVAVVSAAPNPHAARAFVASFASPAARVIIRAHGMEPP
ncbi:MAG: molybdate ABC transporter substrate-binding protein [Xanthobacteraceae bacterium]